MAVSVDIFVKDTQVSPQPISGVVVNVYNYPALTFVTSGSTDGAGQASFLLPGSPSAGTVYEVRFFKAGVIFTNPQLIAVIDPPSSPDTNRFDVSGTVVTLPVATDPRMCRCTGQFIDFSGNPVRNTLVRIIARLGSGMLTKQPDTPVIPWLESPPILPPNIISGFQVPKVLDGKMVSVEAMEAKTDDNGRVTIDLIRQGEYYITFAGEEDHVWRACVPDRSSANLIELIHPEPKTLTWDSTDAPGNAVTVAVGATAIVHFSVLFSNFISYSKNLANIIQFTNSDGTLADLFYDSGNGAVNVTGRAVGTINVTVSVLPEMTPTRIPTYAIAAAPLAVTITP